MGTQGTNTKLSQICTISKPAKFSGENFVSVGVDVDMIVLLNLKSYFLLPNHNPQNLRPQASGPDLDQ